MPTYQYQCTECGEGLEAVQKFTDEALTVCPSCNGRLRKVFSAVGVVFKGSGFYRTDSRNASSSTSSSTSAAAKNNDSSGAESKTSESKTSESKTSESKASGNGSTAGPSSSTSATSTPAA